jgi:CheY-like chemotaxis protein
MTAASAPTAVIAEDEPVLARTLARLLEQVWPELRIVATAEDGLQATELGLGHTPEVMFLDIRMPGRSGLEAAEAVADDWPDGHPEPLFVFITAFDEFAVSAFERAAVDYLLKPATAITAHGLRHEALIEEYIAITGQEPPLRGGGEGLTREREDAARLAVSRLAGHNRGRASAAYLGQSAVMRSKGLKPSEPPMP